MRTVLAFLLVVSTLAPAAAALGVPQGCTYVGTTYACSMESSEPCSSFTAAGAGTGGVVGIIAAGMSGCATDDDGRPVRQDTVIAGGSVGPVFGTLTWTADDAGRCSMVLSTPGEGRELGCPAGGPPHAEWGRLLP